MAIKRTTCGSGLGFSSLMVVGLLSINVGKSFALRNYFAYGWHCRVFGGLDPTYQSEPSYHRLSEYDLGKATAFARSRNSLYRSGRGIHQVN